MRELTAEEKKQQKAKALRYKPDMKEVNNAISNNQGKR